MGDLGTLLRESRERLGISLEKAETDTRIRYRFLAALEDEDYDALPGRVYVKGFLKTYASYLGLDAAHVVDLYNASLGTQSAEATRDVPLVEVPIERPRDLRPLITVLAMVAVVLVLVAGYVRAPWRAWLGLEPPAVLATATPTAEPSPTQAPEQTAAPTATPRPTATTTPQTTEAPTRTPIPGGQVIVTLVVTGRSWVQIVADGEVAYSGLLEDETREWSATERIVARIGNAGAVNVTVNGEALGTLGAAGEVVVQEWLAEGVAGPAAPSSTPAS